MSRITAYYSLVYLIIKAVHLPISYTFYIPVFNVFINFPMTSFNGDFFLLQFCDKTLSQILYHQKF